VDTDIAAKSLKMAKKTKKSFIKLVDLAWKISQIDGLTIALSHLE